MTDDRATYTIRAVEQRVERSLSDLSDLAAMALVQFKQMGFVGLMMTTAAAEADRAIAEAVVLDRVGLDVPWAARMRAVLPEPTDEQRPFAEALSRDLEATRPEMAQIARDQQATRHIVTDEIDRLISSLTQLRADIVASPIIDPLFRVGPQGVTVDRHLERLTMLRRLQDAAGQRTL